MTEEYKPVRFSHNNNSTFLNSVYNFQHYPQEALKIEPLVANSAGFTHLSLRFKFTDVLDVRCLQAPQCPCKETDSVCLMVGHTSPLGKDKRSRDLVRGRSENQQSKRKAPIF